MPAVIPEEKFLVRSSSYMDVPDDGHEDRIQRLENGLSDLKVAHAETSADVKHLGIQLTDLHQHISSKIDAYANHVNQKLIDQTAEVAKINNKLVEHDKFVETVSKERAEQAERWESAKKYVGTAITGAGAIGLKEIVTYLFHFMK